MISLQYERVVAIQRIPNVDKFMEYVHYISKTMFYSTFNV